jgi:hypothetical protein
VTNPKHQTNQDLIWAEDGGYKMRDAAENQHRDDDARIGSLNLLTAIALYFARSRRAKIERDYWRGVVELCNKN